MKHRFLTLLAALMLTVMTAMAAAPKYIFVFIGDGMGVNHAMGAQVYNRTVLKNNEPLRMFTFPVVSQCSTHSASSPVTDSAAAGTAIATGSKTKNGMLGMNADSVAVKSIAAELFDKGYGVAIMTNVPPDDATPGAFYAHVPHRSMFYEIGCQAAESGYDFLGGKALRGVKDKKGNPTDLLDRFKAQGVEIAYGLEDLKTKTSNRVVLLEQQGPVNTDYIYTIDSLSAVIPLPDMTKAALDHLKKNGHKKFFMMVEGGKIDHAAHSNDGGAIIKDVIEFNQALEHAYQFYLAHPRETLIIVTADHETGGLGLGTNSVGYDLHLEYIDCQKISKDHFAEYCRKLRDEGKQVEWDDMKAFLSENLGFWNGVKVKEAQEQALKAEFERCFGAGDSSEHKTLYNSFNTFTDLVFSIMDSVTGLGFTSNCHTAGPVPIYAIGVGAEEFNGFHDNTDFAATLRRLTK